MKRITIFCLTITIIFLSSLNIDNSIAVVAAQKPSAKETKNESSTWIKNYDGHSKIAGDFHLKLQCTGNDLVGIYYDEKGKQDFYLSGHIDKSGKFILNEKSEGPGPSHFHLSGHLSNDHRVGNGVRGSNVTRTGAKFSLTEIVTLQGSWQRPPTEREEETQDLNVDLYLLQKGRKITGYYSSVLGNGIRIAACYPAMSDEDPYSQTEQPPIIGEINGNIITAKVRNCWTNNDDYAQVKITLEGEMLRWEIIEGFFEKSYTPPKMSLRLIKDAVQTQNELYIMSEFKPH